MANSPEAAKIREFIIAKFKPAAEKLLGAEVVKAIEAHAQVPTRAVREPQWQDEIKPKLIKKYDVDPVKLEYFYGCFRRAQRRTYEEHGALTVYKLNKEGDVVPQA